MIALPGSHCDVRLGLRCSSQLLSHANRNDLSYSKYCLVRFSISIRRNMPSKYWLEIQLDDCGKNIEQLTDFCGERPIICSTADGTHFLVGAGIARLSTLFRGVLDASLDAQPREGGRVSPEEIIPLEGITTKTLQGVLLYLETVLTRAPTLIAPPLRSAALRDIVQPWEWSFLLDVGLEARNTQRFQPLISLMGAADFLGVQSLMDLSCAMFASLFMDKSEEELVQLCGLDYPLNENNIQALQQAFPFLKTE